MLVPGMRHEESHGAAGVQEIAGLGDDAGKAFVGNGARLEEARLRRDRNDGELRRFVDVDGIQLVSGSGACKRTGHM